MSPDPTPGRSALREAIAQEHARILARIFGPPDAAAPDTQLAERYLELIRGIASLSPRQLLGLQFLPGYAGRVVPAETEHEAAGELALIRRMADASGDGFAVADAQGDITYANPALCRMYGETRLDAVIGAPMAVFLPEAWQARFRAEVLPAVLREGSWVGELPVRSRAGQVTPAIQAIFVVHRGHDGGVMRIAARVLDRSESEQMAAELRESETRYRELIETIDEVIFALDANGVVRYVSPTLERLTGHGPSEVIGRPVTDLLHPADLSTQQERLALMREGLQIEPQEYRVRLHDGTYHWTRVSTRPIMRDGALFEIRGTLIDIDAHKQIEEALRESEQKYTAVVEQARIGVAIVQDGIVRFVNRYAAALVGLTPDEIVGRPLAEFVAPEDRVAQDDIHRRRMQGEDAPERYRAIGRRRDGTTFAAENTTALIQYRGRPAALAVIRPLRDDETC